MKGAYLALLPWQGDLTPPRSSASTHEISPTYTLSLLWPMISLRRSKEQLPLISPMNLCLEVSLPKVSYLHPKTFFLRGTGDLSHTQQLILALCSGNATGRAQAMMEPGR